MAMAHPELWAVHSSITQQGALVPVHIDPELGQRSVCRRVECLGVIRMQRLIDVFSVKLQGVRIMVVRRQGERGGGCGSAYPSQYIPRKCWNSLSGSGSLA